MDLNAFNLLSLVVYLFMMMNKAHLLIVASNYYSGIVLVNLKNRRKLLLLSK
jgi:hypothetical protein